MPANEPDLLLTAWRIVAERGWHAFSALELARRSGRPLPAVYALFPSRRHLLVALGRRLDAAMLDVAVDELAGMSVRERLFELLMRRFEAMRPFRDGLRAVGRTAACDPALLAASFCNLERAAAWLLDASEAGLEGLRARLARRALQLAYVRTFRVWLADDSDDLARTMAELDRRLAELETLARWLSPRPAAPDADAGGAAAPAPS